MKNKTEERFHITREYARFSCKDCVLTTIDTCYICQFTNCLVKGALIRIYNAEEKHETNNCPD